MRTSGLRERLLREERGFSLSEMLVTISVMLMMFFALYSIFDMSIRVFTFGNDKVEATTNARLGLEKMEREIRQAYPYDNSDPATDYLFPAGGFTPNSITFGNDLNGDYSVDETTEQISYSLSGGTPATLLRNGEPLIEFVQDVDGDGEALTFEYRDETGATTANEADIHTIRIKLEVAVDRGIHQQAVSQTLSTNVALRNRGE